MPSDRASDIDHPRGGSMSDASQMIYGKQPVAEAERGRRRVRRVWRAPEASTEELERLCGSADHQGVVAEVEPYPYAGSGGAAARGERAAHSLGPGAGPAQPGRRGSLGRGGGGGWACRSRAPLGCGDARRLQGIGGGGRAPADRPCPQSRRLAGRGEASRVLDLGRRCRCEAGALGHRPEWADRAGLGRGGQRACARASPRRATG